MRTGTAPRFEEGALAAYLEATHAIGDHLLRRFAAVCTELEIPYYLTSGTLLGAVRSGGWIPWDDDVDVIMFRADYERLRVAIAGQLPEDVAFSSAETRVDHITTIPRLVHLDSHRIHLGRARERAPLETRHIPLDIFILDRAPGGRRVRTAWSVLAQALDRAAVARYTSARDVLAEPATSSGRKVAELVGVDVARILPQAGWHALRTWVVTRPARWGATGPFVATNYSTPRGRHMTFAEEWYLPAGRVEFNGATYTAPGDADAVLTELYGPDYLEPPSAEERLPVHIRGGLEATLGERSWVIAHQAPESLPPVEAAPTATTANASLAGTADPMPPSGTSFRHQVLWSLVARSSAAILQILVLVLLARGLQPALFALVSSAYVALNVVVAVNGFGLLRQIEFRRSRDPDDPSLASLFALRLRFSYGSAALWLVVCLAAYAVTGHEYLLALSPAAIWLLVEQTTQVWNGISVVDGRAQHLVWSYVTRRLPVVVFLAVALALDLHMVWSWTLGLAAGSFVSYLQGVRTQQPWARVLWPRRSLIREKVSLDLGYWWGLVGLQLRDFDVAVVSAVSTLAGGFYAFPARLVSPMNLVTLAAASVAFPRVARAGLTRRQLRRGTLLGVLPVTLVALVVELLSPYLPLLLGDAYQGSVMVLRIACLTAVLSGTSTLLAILLQALSTEDARFVGYLSLGFAVAQITVAGVGAVLGGAVGASAGVAAVSAVLVSTLWFQANRRVST